MAGGGGEEKSVLLLTKGRKKHKIDPLTTLMGRKTGIPALREPAVAASRWGRSVYNCSRSFSPERMTSRVERRPRYRPDRKITEGRAGNCRLNQGGTT